MYQTYILILKRTREIFYLISILSLLLLSSNVSELNASMGFIFSISFILFYLYYQVYSYLFTFIITSLRNSIIPIDIII